MAEIANSTKAFGSSLTPASKVNTHFVATNDPFSEANMFLLHHERAELDSNPSGGVFSESIRTE